MRPGPLALVFAGALAACQPQYERPKVPVRISGSPPDATVIVDDEPVAPLRVVAKHGLKLAPGRHRITIERDGYFPYDRAIDADEEKIMLDVNLVKIPEE